MTRPAVAGGWRRIVGTPRQVRDQVAAAGASGRYDGITPPRVDGQGRVHVYLRERAPEPPTGRRRWPLVAVAAGGTAGTVALAVVAVAWVLDHWAQLAAAGLVALAVLIGLGRRR